MVLSLCGFQSPGSSNFLRTFGIWALLHFVFGHSIPKRGSCEHGAVSLASHFSSLSEKFLLPITERMKISQCLINDNTENNPGRV